MTGQYENALDELRNQNAGDIGIDFESEVWSRVSQMKNQRLARSKNGLAAIMLIAALGGGMLTGQQQAIASPGLDALSGGADYSPASLLRVAP